MRKSAMTRVLAGVLGPVLGLVALTSCGTSERTPAGSGGGGGGGSQPVTDLRVMVPNSPGSGYDLTARAAAKAMEDAQLARNVEVFNLPGASGTVGLQRVVNESGNGKLLMQMGLGVVGRCTPTTRRRRCRTPRRSPS
jgi:putative tricarboxylic transport membrane protein